MVQGKVLDWFDYRGMLSYQSFGQRKPTPPRPESTIYKWLRANALDRLSFTAKNLHEPPAQEVWKERSEAENAMRNYLSDLPSEHSDNTMLHKLNLS